MDIEKLIERMKGKDFERDYDCTPFECGVFGLLDEAATALSTLQAENEKMRVELERVKWENDALWTYIEIVYREYRRYMDRGYIDRLDEQKKVWKRGQKED